MRDAQKLGFVILTSVVVSVITAVIVVTLLKDKWTDGGSRVIQASRVEIVDQQGRVRGSFGLDPNPKLGYYNRLTMRDADGSESIVMFVDGRGDGTLGFASDRWAEGAVILGHLQNVDDGSEAKTKAEKDTSGAWGLRVRSPQSRFTGIGYFNSGRPIPTDAANLPALH